jgi:hypothetical protein
MNLYDAADVALIDQRSNLAVPEGWHLIGWTYNSVGGQDANDGIVFYIDGLLVALAANSTNADYVSMVDTGQQVEIGSSNLGANYFKGDMGHLILGSTVWTADEMLKLWHIAKIKYEL